MRPIDKLPDGATDGFSTVAEANFPDLLTIDGFLNPDECALLVQYAEENRERCADQTGQQKDVHHFDGRVLYCDWQLPDSPAKRLALDAAERMSREIEARFSGGRRVQSESPQLVRWVPPGGMGYHYDEVHPGRVFSGLLYLNAGQFSGGMTAFRDHRIMLEPRLGQVALYSGQTWHGVTDVTDGVRFTLVSFQRWF
jgi:hypothetical protein